MNGNSSSKFASVMAIAAGVILAAGGVCYLLYPSQLMDASAGIYWKAVLDNTPLFRLTNLLFALWAIGTLGLIVAWAERMQTNNGALARWLTTLAIIGMAVGAINFLLILHESTNRAVFINGLYANTPVAGVLMYSGGRIIDPNYELTFGLLGLWLVFVNWNALKQNELPRVLVSFGIVAGLVCLVYVVGSLLWIGLLEMIGKVGAVTVGPIWYIWLGIVLSKSQTIPTSTTQSVPTTSSVRP